MPFLDNPDPQVAGRNLYLETDFGPLDLLSEIQGIGNFAKVRDASIEIELFSLRCRVLSIEALIEAKQALGREKDALAVRELRAILEKKR